MVVESQTLARENEKGCSVGQKDCGEKKEKTKRGYKWALISRVTTNKRDR